MVDSFSHEAARLRKNRRAREKSQALRNAKFKADNSAQQRLDHRHSTGSRLPPVSSTQMPAKSSQAAVDMDYRNRLMQEGKHLVRSFNDWQERCKAFGITTQCMTSLATSKSGYPFLSPIYVKFTQIIQDKEVKKSKR